MSYFSLRGVVYFGRFGVAFECFGTVSPVQTEAGRRSRARGSFLSLFVEAQQGRTEESLDGGSSLSSAFSHLHEKLCMTVSAVSWKGCNDCLLSSKTVRCRLGIIVLHFHNRISIRKSSRS